MFIVVALGCDSLWARSLINVAPGAPGADAHWPTASKNGFGTSTTLPSKVWFTLANGVMTEVFYPTIDTPNTQSLRFTLCKPQMCIDEEQGMNHSLRVLDERSLSFQQINSASGLSITKTYTTDVERSTVLIEVDSRLDNDTSIYVTYDPSLKNSGMHDSAWSSDGALLSSDANVSSALISSSGFEKVSNFFAGKGDELKKPDDWKSYDRAEQGNVVQIGKVSGRKFTLALGFGVTVDEAAATARQSLKKGFSVCRREYESGWHKYLTSLRPFNDRHVAQRNMAAMVLKASEDKTFRGAFIASPSTPWGGGPNANEPVVSGYHAVWSRDLYQVATALAAIGDLQAANRALQYLFKVQQRGDGSFPQNSWVDGRPLGGGLQLDEVALPIVLASQLGVTDSKTWQAHIKPAANFLVSHGPATNQDRWEEKSGYSPATIAAEVAALVCAARVASQNHDTSASKKYLETADTWNSKLADWTVSSNGPHGGSYFLRLTEKGSPNEIVNTEINSGGGNYDQRSIVDSGFLELVRLGLRTASDALVLSSLKINDSLIKVDTPVGPGWYRYNHDAYGETASGQPYDGKTGIGRLWTLLTGERGEYEIALGRIANARQMMDTLAGFANEGMMIPEQVWDRGARMGSGTGSATPLAWSMAQFLRLATNIEIGRNTEMPQIVAARYARKPAKSNGR